MAIIKEELRLTDLIEVSTLQKMQDAFAAMTGVAVITTDSNGVAVTEPSDFSDFCINYVRSTEAGMECCEKCDKMGAEMARNAGDSCAYFCHAGLMDFAAPIMTGGHMVGCFIGGQVLTEPIEDKVVADVAKRIGVDENKLIEAAHGIKIVDKSEIKKVTAALYDIANVLSEIAFTKHELYLKNLELEKASHMKSDFLANMSHEIRTPMNAVIGMAEMALREDISPSAKNYISQIKSSGQALLTIINDILDFSKIESGKMDINETDYEPMSLINDVVNIIMTRISNKKLELTLDVNPDLPHELHGDNIRVKQIIVNLANNAVKFTDSGNVHLKIDFKQTKEDQIILKAEIADTGSGIKKQDMAKLFQSFQQVDSKRNRNIEGTGLGLAICKQLLSLMDGEIQVNSVYGEGSTFSFSLPQKIVNKTPSIERRTEKMTAAGLVDNKYIAKEMETDILRFGVEYFRIESEEELSILEEKEARYLFVEQPLFTDTVYNFIENHPDITGVVLVNFRATRTYNLPNIRVIKKPLYTLSLASIFHGEDIYTEFSQMEADDFDFTAPDAEILVVDDNAINLTVVEGLLAPLDMKIETALSGKEAVAKIMGKRYDIIFMDHMMPGMDGIEAAQIIRRDCGENGTAPVMAALTANAMEGMREHFLECGFDDFISKPLDRAELNQLLLRWVPETGRQMKEPEAETTLLDQEAFQIDGIDINAAMQYYSGGGEGFADLLEVYSMEGRRKTALLQELVETDLSRYQIEVHGLKSASANIGATKVSEMARAHENAAARKDRGFIDAQFQALMAEYETLLANIGTFLEQRRQEHGQEEKLPGLPLQQLREQMAEALEELKHFRSKECAQQIDSLLLHELPQDTGERLLQIREQLRLYEDDYAEELLGQLLDMLEKEDERK